MESRIWRRKETETMGARGILYEFKNAVSTAVELAPTDHNNCVIRTNKMYTFYITSTQVFLGFPLSLSKCWDGSQHSKLPLHASHVALPT